MHFPQLFKALRNVPKTLPNIEELTITELYHDYNYLVSYAKFFNKFTKLKKLTLNLSNVQGVLRSILPHFQRIIEITVSGKISNQLVMTIKSNCRNILKITTIEDQKVVDFNVDESSSSE